MVKAKFQGKVQAVGGNVDNHYPAGPHRPVGFGEKQAHRPGPDDHHGVAGLQRGANHRANHTR